uniref:Leukotriene C4 synthase n=1 Tax=Ursus americanus TaxID=9643 RepID=A0A452RAR2_URSAM
SILDAGQAQKQGVGAKDDPLGWTLFIFQEGFKGQSCQGQRGERKKGGNWTEGASLGAARPDSRPSSPPAYFSLQVISARRAFRVSPPLTTGPPEFERVYRAQVNCSEYFPLFLATLWVAGIFFHEGLRSGRARTHRSPRVPCRPAHLAPLPGTAALCGLVYLFARLRYFQGYARSAQQR